jgi:transposase
VSTSEPGGEIWPPAIAFALGNSKKMSPLMYYLLVKLEVDTPLESVHPPLGFEPVIENGTGGGPLEPARYPGSPSFGDKPRRAGSFRTDKDGTKELIPMKIIAGIDVSKQFLDVCLLDNGKPKAKRFANCRAGIRQLTQFLKSAERVVLEPTSTYHEACARELFGSGLEVCLVNPYQSRSFARACLKRNKTDQVDAITLATLGNQMELRKWTPPSSNVCELRGLLRVRNDLSGAIAKKRTQVQTPGLTNFEENSYRRQLSALQGERKAADNAIASLLKSPEFAERAERLLSVPGVGVLIAATYLALIPELVSPKAAAAFVGINPRVIESGQMRGVSRLSKQGDPKMRQLLYLAAWHARRDCGPLQKFYERKLDEKKSKQSALCALAHKLMRILWAVHHKGAAYNAALLTKDN